MKEKIEFPEGATSISDCSGLIPHWVHHLSDLNRVEAENILSAQKKYLSGAVSDPKNWFQVGELKAIHRAMFGKVWEWAGVYRKSVTSLGINPALIPAQLGVFCAEVHAWLEHPVELTFVEQAARVHHRLVFIHPFENGNGRFSRLIADRFLLAFRCSYPLWPNQLNKEGVLRKNYIQTLKSADTGDYTPLIELMLKLGARDPTLTELNENPFYRPWIQGKKGVALVNALIRNKSDPNDGHGSAPVTLSCGDPRLPPLIFLHGFLGCKEDWDEMLPFFSGRFHCIAIDLPGHGGTPYCEDILRLLRKTISAMGHRRPVLLGYSMGGRLAMQLCDLAAAIVVLSGHPGLETSEEREKRLQSDRVWVDKLLRLPIEDFLADWYAQPVFGSGVPIPERRKKQNQGGLARALLQLSLAHQTPMDHFPCPALFLHGEKDLKYGEVLSRIGHSVTVRQIEGCGHALHIENVARCAETVLSWMESLYANTGNSK